MYHRFSGLLYWSSIRIVVNHVGGYWIVPGNNYLCFLEWEIILKMMTILAGAGHCHYGQFATIPPQQDVTTFLSFFDKIKILKWFETTINHMARLNLLIFL